MGIQYRREQLSWPIVRPGRNCWRVATAHRASVLVDAADYFKQLDIALRAAQRSITIIGWDFDGRICLGPNCDNDPPISLGQMLRQLVEERPELEVRILVWSIAVVHAPSSPAQMLLGADWQNHPRIQLRLDSKHPIYGAHHQKLVCIDDALAFCGGIDLTVRRWDDCHHHAHHDSRKDPNGIVYSPVHDVQMVVNGGAARALGTLARDRWQNAIGEKLEPIGGTAERWIEGLEPTFNDVSIAIARTMPGWGEQEPTTEAGDLTIDALMSARKAIYIETQYLTNIAVGQVLTRKLMQRDGPDVVIIVTETSHGLVEQLAMGTNRDRLIHRLKRADKYDRLRVYYPVVPGPDGACPVLIHAKVIFVDDNFVRVGSFNLNNRSFGLDTECDLAVEAHNDDVRQRIAALRDTMIGEHLGAEPEAVRQALIEEKSLVRAVDRLNQRARGLCPFPALWTRGPTRPMMGTTLLDPHRPFVFSGLIKRLTPSWFDQPRTQ